MRKLLQVHFIALLLNVLLVSFIFFTKYENIAKSNVQSSSYADAVSFVDAFLIISEIMYGVIIVCTLFGVPFAKQALSLEIVFEVLGVICYGLYILLRMHYLTISYIWGVFCLLPFLIAVFSMIFRSRTLFKYSNLYENVSERPRLRNRQEE